MSKKNHDSFTHFQAFKFYAVISFGKTSSFLITCNIKIQSFHIARKEKPTQNFLTLLTNLPHVSIVTNCKKFFV